MPPTAPAPRASLAPATGTTATMAAAAAIKPRQLAHLHAQLAQLQAHLADLENLARMTAVQAEFMRELGGWSGGLFMAASKVLGEEEEEERARRRGERAS